MPPSGTINYIHSAWRYTFLLLLLGAGAGYGAYHVEAVLYMYPLLAVLAGHMARKLTRHPALPPGFFSRFWPLIVPIILLFPLPAGLSIFVSAPFNDYVSGAATLTALGCLMLFWLGFLVFSEMNHGSDYMIEGLVLSCGLLILCLSLSWQLL